MTFDLLLKKFDLKRLGFSRFEQQAGVAFQQAGVAFQPAGVASQQAGVAFQQADVAFQPAGVASQQAGVAFQQADVAFQQAGVAFQQIGVAFQQAGVAFQHLLPNQESPSRCSQTVSRTDTNNNKKVKRHKQRLHAGQQKHEHVCCRQKKKDMRPTCAYQWTHAECAHDHASTTLIITATSCSS